MFGWLKKRFGKVQIGKRRYGYADLAALDLGHLQMLGLKAAQRGEAVATAWVVDAVIDHGGLCVSPAVAIVEAAQGTLPPDDVVKLHVTLAGCFTVERSTDERIAVMRAQIDLAHELVGAGALNMAEALLEQALPAVVNVDRVPPAIAALLLEAARLARAHKWDRAVLVLLDRKVNFANAQEHKEACLLIGIALGGGERALTHLESARSANPDDVECHYLLGQAHATRAKKAGSQSEFDTERKKSLEHMDEARRLAAQVDSHSVPFSGVVLGAVSGVALLALMAPTYDEIMYLEAPLKGAQSGGAGSMSE
jgi:hypothetical protein